MIVATIGGNQFVVDTLSAGETLLRILSDGRPVAIYSYYDDNNRFTSYYAPAPRPFPLRVEIVNSGVVSEAEHERRQMPKSQTPEML